MAGSSAASEVKAHEADPRPGVWQADPARLLHGPSQFARAREVKRLHRAFSPRSRAVAIRARARREPHRGPAHRRHREAEPLTPEVRTRQAGGPFFQRYRSRSFWRHQRSWHSSQIQTKSPSSLTATVGVWVRQKKQRSGVEFIKHPAFEKQETCPGRSVTIPWMSVPWPTADKGRLETPNPRGSNSPCQRNFSPSSDQRASGAS